MVECLVWDQDAAGSSPVTSTIEKTALESQFLAFWCGYFLYLFNAKIHRNTEKTGKMLGKCKAGKVRYNRYFQAFKKCDIMQNH